MLTQPTSQLTNNYIYKYKIFSSFSLKKRMEGKSLVAILVTMMVIGNLLPQTEAQKIPFMQCFPACMIVCKSESKFPKFLTCPI